MLEILSEITKWSNDNQGVLGVILFLAAIVFGWISGIFSALRRKPKFRINLIEGPTFTCTFGTGKKEGKYDIHRTGIALYLNVANVGSAPANIEHVHVGYHWAIKPFGKLWWQYRIGWYWLYRQAIILADFQAPIGEEHTKIYPFLFQKNFNTEQSNDTYLVVGKSTNGVVYFEQEESFGACFPLARNNLAKIKIKVIDSFRRSYVVSTKIPRLSLEEAKKYNPRFGSTLSTLHGWVEPLDLPVDKHGNLIPPPA